MRKWFETNFGPDGAFGDIPGGFSAPAIKCVYIWFGENNIPLYVGATSNLYMRVTRHLNGTTQFSKECGHQIRKLAWIKCKSRRERLDLELFLIKTLHPAYNCLGAGKRKV